MSIIVVLGKSAMVMDIIPYLKEHRVLNRNTDEPPLPQENETCLYLSCIGSPKYYTTKLNTLNETTILGHWCSIDVERGHIYHNGKGTLIFPYVYLSTSAKLGWHCLIMPHATINHDCVLGDGSNIASGAILNGSVELAGSCFIGAGSVIKENVKICKNVLIGANSYVNKDILIPGIYVGSPARKLYD